MRDIPTGYRGADVAAPEGSFLGNQGQWAQRQGCRGWRQSRGDRGSSTPGDFERQSQCGGTPVKSKANSTPPLALALICSSAFGSMEFTAEVTPNSSAKANLS